MHLIDDERNDVRYLVPAEHGGVFSSPSLRAAGQLIARNQDRFLESEVSELAIAGESLSDLRSAAREELPRIAEAYTWEYWQDAQVGRLASAAPLILTGHQPQLFHPGVWIKNFAASMLAGRHQGMAINVLIDNDVVGHPHISVPILDGKGQPNLVKCSIDVVTSPRPYEVRDVVDRSLFDSFADRAAELVGPLVADPLVTEIWPSAVASAARQGNLGRALAEARHVSERQCGLETWEVPLSLLCETDSFRRFVARLLFDIRRFVAVYNASILGFRQRHRLRSRAHPAPVLTLADGAVETPFWVWTQADQQRQPLITRQIGQTLSLRHGWDGAVVGQVPAGSAREIAESLAELSNCGVRIRPRALLTTLYLRLILSDLFIHGIGGGKYDEVTNAIVRDYFRLSPPEFLVMSATFRLPFGMLPVQMDDVRQVDGLLRELHYHPEHCVEQLKADDLDEFQRLVDQKRHWVARKPKGSARDWHQRLEQLNDRMRAILEPSRVRLKAERNRLADCHHGEKIILSREFSLCLFSANGLRRELLDLVGKN